VVVDIKERTWAEHIWEHGAEEIVLTKKGRSNMRVENISQREAS
jgi:hypothetical protein